MASESAWAHPNTRSKTQSCRIDSLTCLRALTYSMIAKRRCELGGTITKSGASSDQETLKIKTRKCTLRAPIEGTFIDIPALSSHVPVSAFLQDGVSHVSTVERRIVFSQEHRAVSTESRASVIKAKVRVEIGGRAVSNASNRAGRHLFLQR